MTTQRIIDVASVFIDKFPSTTTKIGVSERPDQETLKNYADGLNRNNGLYIVAGPVADALKRCNAPTFQ